MALSNKAKIPIGTVLAGKYRVTREIGRGGMAAVYEAENVDIGKRVAIKVLAQELTTSTVVVERFLREARAAAAIRSPYICDVYDSGRLDDGRPFLVLELLEGESLYERMTVVRHLDLETTVTVMAQVCRGLTKAHSASIVHRDLKPENIFLTKDEEGGLLAKILDFGLAKFYAPINPGDKQARLTREGAVFGTPAYMSPEQVRGQGAVDHRADLWALGCITYECLTGRTVWQTEQGVAMTFAQIANAPLPRPQALRSDLPDGFTEWFDQALNRSIEKRFQTAKEFADQLSIALGIAQPQGPRGIEPSQALISPPVDSQIPVDLSTGDTPLDAGEALQQETAAQEKAPLTPAASKVVSGVERVNAHHDRSMASPGAISKSLPQQKRALGNWFLFFGLVVLVAGGFAIYRRFFQTKASLQVATTAPAVSSAPAVPTASSIRDTPLIPDLPWAQLVGEAQQALTSNDIKTAAKLLKDAYDKGGHGVPRTMIEHLQVAMKEPDSKKCNLTGLARPRTYDLASSSIRPVNAGRPSIAYGSRGLVMTWTDTHEGSEHAYTAALDAAMKTVATPIDVTPEGLAINHPELTRVGDKLVVTYWDARGPEAGVHVRWLDADGRIAGPSVSVASKSGNFWPSLAVAGDGFYVFWSDEFDPASEDLFFRRLSSDLEPVKEILRATDIAPHGRFKPRARYPSIAVQGDALHVAFRLEKEPQHLIQHIRLPLADADKGVTPSKSAARTDQMIGETSLVNVDKARSDGPSIACHGQGCFLVWHGDAPTGGASAAYIGPGDTQPLWRKKFAKLGMHPTVGIAPNGEAQLFWYESGRLATASISRDGIGPSTKFARVSSDQPMPSVTAGSEPGEWYVAWLDYETGHLEPYAARVLCR